MGAAQTEWEAAYGTHRILVKRNELTRGFYVEVDKMIIAHKNFALFGTGDVEGAVELDGKRVTVKVKLIVGEGCIVHVEGQQLPVTLVK
ncbi:MAG: hypothetical protein HY908_02605 [Myxococcales bacterium]|nr:hypothetical protein [Myxococcales bacterium]